MRLTFSVCKVLFSFIDWGQRTIQRRMKKKTFTEFKVSNLFSFSLMWLFSFSCGPTTYLSRPYLSQPCWRLRTKTFRLFLVLCPMLCNWTTTKFFFQRPCPSFFIALPLFVCPDSSWLWIFLLLFYYLLSLCSIKIVLLSNSSFRDSLGMLMIRHFYCFQSILSRSQQKSISR